jgi:hypothetical protein
MEPWGMMMAGITLFGMLGLVIASLRMDEGSTSTASSQEPEATTSEATVFKKAA